VGSVDGGAAVALSAGAGPLGAPSAGGDPSGALEEALASPPASGLAGGSGTVSGAVAVTSGSAASGAAAKAKLGAATPVTPPQSSA